MLMIEFWENGVKQGECPAQEVFDMPAYRRESFWAIQDETHREIRLRIQEEGEK